VNCNIITRVPSSHPPYWLPHSSTLLLLPVKAPNKMNKRTSTLAPPREDMNLIAFCNREYKWHLPALKGLFVHQEEFCWERLQYIDQETPTAITRPPTPAFQLNLFSNVFYSVEWQFIKTRPFTSGSIQQQRLQPTYHPHNLSVYWLQNLNSYKPKKTWESSRKP
jgi:hypothetical protein